MESPVLFEDRCKISRQVKCTHTGCKVVVLPLACAQREWRGCCCMGTVSSWDHVFGISGAMMDTQHCACTECHRTAPFNKLASML